MSRILAFSLLAWLAACALAHAVEAVPNPTEPPTGEDLVQACSATNALQAPDAAAEVAFSVPAGTELTWISHAERDGYYRIIRQDRGPQAWIAADALTLVHEHEHGLSKPARHCAATLDDCPVRGCAADGTPEAKANEYKRSLPSGALRATLDVDDFVQLQRQADELVGQGPRDISLTQRQALHGLTVKGATVAEGDRVRMLAYIPRGGDGLHVNGAGESVNCMLKSPADNDFHIPVAQAADDDETRSIVAEMIPQQRPPEWNIDALKEIREQGAQLWIEGGLSYDNVHYVNADRANPLRDDPFRLSLWEIHPITKFLVCRKAHCDPADESDWSALASK